MNVDTGQVISGEEYAALDRKERGNYIAIRPGHRLAKVARERVGSTLFKHPDADVRAAALVAARQHKARRRKLAKASQRRNRA